MKRIRPVDESELEHNYPSRREADPERREALGRLLGGVATGGALLLGWVPPGAAAAEERGRGYRAHTFHLLRTYWFRGCRVGVSVLHVQSRDTRLIAFVKDARERAGIDAAFRKVLAGATCHDLNNQKRLVRLQHRLGDALASRYRARRKRSTARPIITLVAGRRRPIRPLPGKPAHP